MVCVLPRAELPFLEDEKAILQELSDCVNHLKEDSSPGYPYMREYLTNEALWEAEGKEFLVFAAFQRLVKLDGCRDRLLSMSSEELVEAGFCDPVRMFAKNEIQGAEKIREGRVRLIFNVSVVDQVVERFLCSRLHAKEIANWSTLPVKPGMGLSDDGLEQLSESICDMVRPVGTDMSGYDMHVVVWLLMMVAAVTAMQYGVMPFLMGGPLSLWEKRAYCILNALVISTDGYVLAQIVAFLMKSGSYFTSRWNSVGRCLLRLLVAQGKVSLEVLMRMMAMGDDCIEDLHGYNLADLRAAYGRFGMVVKEVEDASATGSLEFCAYRFYHHYAKHPEPTRPWKMVATFLVTWPAPEAWTARYDALARELRHAPQKQDYLDVVLYVRRRELEGGS